MYKDRIRPLQAQYVFEEHESPGEHRRNAQLVEEFGLTEYLAERFTMAGSPDDIRDKIDQLTDLRVTKLLMAFFGESDRDEKHHRLATEVMPHFR
ncbi:hypothetical protein C2W62_50130 [Candidatus Entotheonella serta]|nr:hypothetical protein C2W62_50130 [Candidatus Entotheonella serta]